MYKNKNNFVIFMKDILPCNLFKEEKNRGIIQIKIKSFVLIMGNKN